MPSRKPKSMESSDALLDPTLARVLENLPFPIALTRQDKEDEQVVSLNPQFTRSFGYTRRDFNTLSGWARLAYPDDAYRMQVIGQWIQDLDAARESGGVVPTREVEIMTKLGQTRRVLVNGIPLDTPLGRVVVVCFVDVSEQRLTEAELRSVRYALERTAYELTENIPVGTYTMVQPADGGLAQFRFMSTRFLELTGLKREEAWLDPLKGFACVHPEDFDQWVQLNVQAFSTRTRFFGETRVVIDGEVRWITAESEPRTLADGSTVWEGVLTDITARKLTEHALIAAKTKAERLERVKSDFLTQMSHEIRTPLATMMGLAELLSRDTGLSPTQQEKVSQLQNSGAFLLSIVNDILDLSKIEAGQLAIESLPFSLDEVLEQTKALRETLTSPSVQFHLHPPPTHLPLLRGDSRRLSQVLINLVGNAIKFTASGKVEVRVDILSQGASDVRLRFNVIDTGIGIEPSIIASLFDPFTQADTGISRRFGGSGLGLSIAKQLIELMQGSIDASSEPGKGSHFWFDLYFEFANVQTQSIELEPRNQPKTSASGHRRLLGKHLLIVDDSASIRALVAEFLSLEGATYDFAYHGADALEKIRKHANRFDAVLMDMQMPVMDGLSATRAIKEDLGFTQMPILAMTAGLLAEQRAHVRSVGITDVVSKPIHFEGMIKLLEKAMQNPSICSAPATPTAGTKATKPTPAIHPTAGLSAESAKHQHRSDTQAPRFPDIVGINREDAQNTMDDNPDRFERQIALFATEFETIGEEIAACLRAPASNHPQTQPDRLNAIRLAHSIRGAASQIGARSLKDIATALEIGLETALKENAPTPDHLVQQLNAEIKRLVQAIRTHQKLSREKQHQRP
jgi:PAS domain S-box-containing protein